MGKVFWGGHPRHFICTDASRGLSETAEFLALVRLRFNVLSIDYVRVINCFYDYDYDYDYELVVVRICTRRRS